MAKSKSGMPQIVDVDYQETTSDDHTYARDPTRAEFCGFMRSNIVFSWDTSGVVISRKLVWPQEPVSVMASRLQFSLPFKVRELGEFPALPVGLVIITGKTAAGKSTFLRALARQMSVERVLAVEPHDTGEEVQLLPTFISADSALAHVVSRAYTNPATLYAIDSLRAPLFETPGAAGSKGLSMPFFSQVTRVSNCLAKAGITILATVNPMDEDAEYVAAFMSKLSAAVPATISLTSVSRFGGGDSVTETFFGSLQIRPRRAQMAFEFTSGHKAEHEMKDLLSQIEFTSASTNDAISPRMANIIEQAFDKAV